MNFAVIGINNWRRPRGPNINRMSCQSKSNRTIIQNVNKNNRLPKSRS